MIRKYGKPIVLLVVGAFLFWGAAGYWKMADAQNRPGVIPAGGSAANYSPISDGALESSAPVTIQRPLEVPELYAFDRVIDADLTQVILVDSRSHRICVYQVDRQGTIEFKANRDFQWDLKLSDFNSQGLTPSQIREMYEKSSGGTE